jgi:hypothetical protein
MAILPQVGIVAEGTGISIADVNRCTAAIQKQVSRDFGPIWNINATVDAFATLEEVPLGYWPVIVQENLAADGALGFHVDKNGQPYALVKHTDGWETTVSHETLEMLADPFGNRIVSCPSVKEGQGRVQYLVEVCDPSEAPQYGYTANGVLVSDFYTPHYFDPVGAPNVRYSFTGAITQPRQVLKGGYLSWFDPVSGHVFQEIYFDDAPEFRDLGAMDAAAKSLRAEVDRLTPRPQLTEGIPAAALQGSLEARGTIERSTTAWAAALREEIAAL